jgi:hypothetical protein
VTWTCVCVCEYAQQRSADGRHAAWPPTHLLPHISTASKPAASTLTLNPPTPTTAVWYEIYTLSRPGTLVASAAHPVLRAFQRKFAADSCDAMQREMAAGAGSGK